jgi:LysM repeat protein
MQDSIANYKADEYFNNRMYAGDSGGSTEKVIHTVKSGENLITIANKYGVTASSVRKWNGLRSNKVGVGRRLIIYADNGGYAISSSSGKQDNTKPSNKKPFAAYKVRKGDSLSSIAKKFKCSQSELKSLNKMKSSAIKEGQYLRIPLK